MALTVAELRAVMSADVNPFMAGMRKLDGAPARMAKVGRAFTMYLTVPLLAAGGYAAHLGAEFQAAMLRIHTQAGASTRDVRVLSRQVLELATHAQQGPVELANSLYHLKSVGMDNVSAMKALRQSSHFAALGGADLEETTNALAGAWRTGIRGSKNFRREVATLNAILGSGNMRMHDLNEAMGTGFLISARTFGLTLKDAGAALALLTDESMPASVAATRLRMSIALLGAPSQAAEKQLKVIGLTGLQLAHTMRQPHGLIKTLALIKTHLEKSFPHDAARRAELLSRAFGGGRSGAAIMSLVTNLDVLRQKQAQIERTARGSHLGDALGQQAETAQAKVAKMKARLEDAAVLIRKDVLPAMNTLVGWVSKLADGFDHLSPKTRRIIVLVGGVVAVLGPLLIVLGLVARGVEAVGVALRFLATNPILLVLSLLVLGFIAAYTHSETFRKIVNKAARAVADAVKFLWDMGKRAFPYLVLAMHILGAAGQWLWDKALKPVFGFIVDAVGHLLVAWGHMLRALGHVPGFGWAKAAGDMMIGAGHAAEKLADKIRGIPKKHTTHITADTRSAREKIADLHSFLLGVTGHAYTADVTVNTHGGGGLSRLLGQTVQPTQRTARASGGSLRAFQMATVGENGREWFVPNVNGRVVSNAELRALTQRRHDDPHAAALLAKLAAAGPRVKVDQHVTANPQTDTGQLADAAADRLVGQLAALGVTV
ncbi:MAG TPA: phage tail tape measure protein [Spirillospora sp.]|nr:phage tail tape measure protein [Spirillospora sp.]